MGSKLAKLASESGVPGLSHIFAVKGLRKGVWTFVFILFVSLTIRDLIDMLKDYTQFPVSVGVRITDSRVLPFPAVTVCNLNAVHRGRFCNNKKIEKPTNVAKILCANLGDLLDSCEISKMLDELLDKGRQYCGGGASKATTTDSPQTKTQSKTRPKSGPRVEPKKQTLNTTKGRRRGKRQINLSDVVKTVRDVGTFVRGDGSKGSGIGGIINGIQDTVKSFSEGGGPMDGIITQIANVVGFNISSTADIVPTLFMRAFTEVTGCRLGSGSAKSAMPEKLRNTLSNLTQTFTSGSCFLKLPKLVGLFQEMSQKMANTVSKCTSPWVDSLKGSINKGETPWFILLDLLSSWLAELAKNDPSEAKAIGHQSEHLIQQCYFAGRHCYVTEDFSDFFYNSYGNCFTYNLHLNNNQSLNESKGALSGFTGPKFGLELTLDLETDQYMPTSREAGAKVIVHDSATRADPDQDSVHVPPGLVTYVGVRLVNITRLPDPYPDKCSDDWQDMDLKKWAKHLSYETYSSQICLKLCLQSFTIKHCKCWSSSSPPPQADVLQCNTRKNRTQEECTEMIRQMYYNETISCNCPPRCSERSFEKFVSTGKELPQCSALSSPNSEASAEEKENFAKVVIYFQSLSYQEINQFPKYTLTALLGGIGGILGVYLGFSFIAIFELIEVFSRYLMCGSEKTSKKKSIKQKNKTKANATKVNTISTTPIKKAFE